MLQPGQEICGFSVQSSEDLPEIDGTAVVMHHAFSGAKLLYLQNDDENKAFSIAFKTPPADDTGVFHILEHSVLCGSEKFPVKEPFVNLLRTSMQTFLNAMTFPDKTMYPVASTNEQDLLNLMDVYLDAVLHPALYREQEIFEQEGWHYEVERTPEGDPALVYNGVVFNEMKGALSDPEDVLYHAMNKALFEGTCYACESGGHPRAIPQLTYDGYCDTHARHYRLDNSYIVLYGNLDIQRVLGFLDERYLGVAQEPAPGAPNPVGTIRPVLSFDNVVEMATAPENAMVGLGYVVGPAHDFERVLAADILMDALMGGNESPIKRAVLDAQLGGDCTAYLLDSQERDVALFVLKNAKPGVAEQFRTVVESQVRALVEGGIPRGVLEASLAQMSFALRERDRGVADGVALAMNALSGWLYNDADATTYLHYEQPLATMRAGLDGRYFEDVLHSLVLDNDHVAMVEVRPVAEDGPSAEDEQLAALLATLSDEDVAAIEQEVERLRMRQEAPDAAEDLAKLPQLHVSDIGPAKPDPAPEVRTDTPLPCVCHNLSTRHIDYLNLYFDLSALAWDDMPYVVVLSLLLGNLDTQDHTAAELDVFVRQHLGRLIFCPDINAEHGNPSTVYARLVVSASALAEEVEHLATIPQEVFATTCFADAGRIRDVLVQKRISMEESFMGSGHTHAMARLASYLFPKGVLGQQLGGVDFYLFLKDLIDNFDDRFAGLAARLEDLQRRIFVAENCVASFAGAPEEMDAFWQAAGTLGLAGAAPQSLEAFMRPVSCIPSPQLKREAFAVPTDVVFVGKGADVGVSHDRGPWTILTRALSFDYLWNEVRVKGGAYGCGFRNADSGMANFYSYRDPQLDATLQRFDAAGEWLFSFDPSESEMEGYVVSSVAAHDAPAKPRAIVRRQDAALFAKRPQGWREQVRASLLETTPEAIRALAPQLEKIVQNGAVCVFGNADIMAASQEGLEHIRLLDA